MSARSPSVALSQSLVRQPLSKSKHFRALQTRKPSKIAQWPDSPCQSRHGEMLPHRGSGISHCAGGYMGPRCSRTRKASASHKIKLWGQTLSAKGLCAWMPIYCKAHALASQGLRLPTPKGPNPPKANSTLSPTHF